MWKIYVFCSVGWLLVKQVISNNFFYFTDSVPFLRHSCTIHWTAENHDFIPGKNDKQSACAAKDTQLFIANSITYIILWLLAIELEAIHILFLDMGWIVAQSNFPSWKPIHWELIVSQLNCIESYHRKYYSSISLDTLQGVYQEGERHHIWRLLGKQVIDFHKVFSFTCFINETFSILSYFFIPFIFKLSRGYLFFKYLNSSANKQKCQGM